MTDRPSRPSRLSRFSQLVTLLATVLAACSDSPGNSVAPLATDGGSSTGVDDPSAAAGQDAAAPDNLVKVSIDDTVVGTGDRQFEYAGAWQTSTGAAKYKGSDHFASVAGATATLRFTGPEVWLYGALDTHHGIVAFSVDSGPETTFDAYATARRDQALLFHAAGLAAAPHTVRFRATGTKNAASTDAVVTLDRADAIVRGAPVATDAGPTTPGDAGGPLSLITRSGQTLLRNGQPWRFVRWNLGGAVEGCNLTNSFDLVQLEDFVKTLPAHGSATRIWLFHDAGIQRAKDVLNVFRKYNQYTVVTLSNSPENGGACGGSYSGDDWYMTMAQTFAADPVIAMWEVQNEGSNAGFYQHAADVLKTNDPKHLVASGTSAAYGNVGNWAAINGYAAIDVASLHEYDEVAAVSSWWNEVHASAVASNKPIMVGELGITGSTTGDPNNHSSNGAVCQSWSGRVATTTAKIQDYLAKGAVGALYWQAFSQHVDGCGYSTGPDDPLHAGLAALSP